MDITQILTIAIPTIATVIVGFILKRQISSQNELLKNYEAYIKSTDWKNVKSYYEEVILPNEKTKIEKNIEDELDGFFKEEVEPNMDKVQIQLEELSYFTAATLLNMGRAKGTALMNELLPTSQQFFSERLDEMWKRNDGAQKNP